MFPPGGKGRQTHATQEVNTFHMSGEAETFKIQKTP